MLHSLFSFNNVFKFVIYIRIKNISWEFEKIKYVNTSKEMEPFGKQESSEGGIFNPDCVTSK